MKSVVDNCLEMCDKAQRRPYFYLTGGDPILHPRFWDLLELLQSKKIEFGILGNPFHLDDSVCARLRSYGCDRYQLSLDGLRDTHDDIRKKGSFDKTLEKIDCINKSGMTSVIMTTVSKMNIDEIPGLIDLVVEKKVDVFSFARYCPSGFEKSNHIEPGEYRDFLGVCWEKFDRYKDTDTTFYLKDHLWTLFLHERGLYEIPQGLDENTMYDGCNCGNCHITILSDGEIHACRRFSSHVGNVQTDALYDVFTGPQMDKYRDFEKFEKCSKCELKRFCRGCPAVAYGYTGNSFAGDPQCWKDIK